MKPRNFPLARLLACLALLFASSIALLADESITLNEAVSRALQNHPSLAVFDADKRAAEARLISALAKPNPELESEVEDVLGTGSYRNFESAIYNVGVSQLIETGGKRRLRGEVANSKKAIAELQYDLARRELIAETGTRYVQVLAAQAEVKNALEIRAIASDAHSAILQQIEGGRGSAADSGQALLGKNEAELAYRTALQKASLARQQLSAMWADATPDFTKVVGELSPPSHKTTSIESLNDTVPDHPAVQLSDAAVTAAGAQLNLQQKQRVPDITVGLGVRRDSAVDDNAVVLSFSLPLPLFNNNEGGIAEAQAGIERSEALLSQARTQVVLKIAAAHSRLLAAQAEYQLVSGEMLDAAEAHHRTFTEGFSLGRIKYLELLEARRTLTAVREQRIGALSKYHAARVDLEALTGKKL